MSSLGCFWLDAVLLPISLVLGCPCMSLLGQNNKGRAWCSSGGDGSCLLCNKNDHEIQPTQNRQVGIEGRNVPRFQHKRTVWQKLCFYAQPDMGQAPFLPYASRCMNRVKHRVFFKSIFLCLPPPRGRISLQKIKNVITFANIKTI